MANLADDEHLPEEPVLLFGQRPINHDGQSDDDHSDSEVNFDPDLWEEETLNKASQVTVRVDPYDAKLLEIAEKEFTCVLERARSKARALGYNDLTNDAAVFELFLKPYVVFLTEHVNAVRGKGRQPITDVQVINFLSTELACAMLHLSPTALFGSPKFAKFATTRTPDEYWEVYRTLSCLPDHVPYKLSPTLKDLERIVNDACRWCFTDESIIALDDDKPNISGKKANSFGLNARKIKKNFGPVLHTMASVITELFIGVHFERTNDSVVDCIQSLLLMATRETLVQNIDMNNLVTKDRGYNTMNTSQECQRLGLRELGTRKKEANFPLTFDTDPKLAEKRGQRLIPTSGDMGAYFIRRNRQKDDKRTMDLFGVAFRRYGRVVLATTTETELGPFRFHLKTKPHAHDIKKLVSVEINPAWKIDLNGVQVEMTSGHVHSAMTRAYHHVNEITRGQRDPLWFIQRRYRITSSIAYSALTRALKAEDSFDPSDDLTWIADTIGFHLPVQAAAGEDSDNEEQVESRIQFLVRHFSAKQLSDFCRNFGETGPGRPALAYSGTKTAMACRLIQAGFDIQVDGHMVVQRLDSVEQVLHDTWFMHPHSKAKNNFDLEKGTANEEQIPGWLHEFLEKKTHFRLCHMQESGLVVNDKLPYLATSVDGVGAIYDRTRKTLHPCLFEFKTRVAKKAQANIQNILNTPGNSSFMQLNLECDADRVKFKKVVPHIGYRQQLFHHAATWGIDRIMYVETTQSDIVYCVLLEIPYVKLLVYRDELIQNTFGKYVKIFHDHDADNDLLQQIVDYADKHKLEMGWATDLDTYKLQFALWKVLDGMASASGPLPRCAALLIAMIDGWNILKGGVDVLSRLLANVHALHERQNLPASLFLRSFYTLVAECHLVHRAVRVFRALPPGQTLQERYGTLSNFREALNHAGSFRDFVETNYTALSRIVVKDQDEPSSSHGSAAASSIASSESRRSIRDKRHEIVEKLQGEGHEHKYGFELRRHHCVVCCSRCNGEKKQRTGELEPKGHQEHTRQGRPTTTGCRECYSLLGTDMSSELGMVFLCHEPFSKEETRTCFEIWHDTVHHLPTLNCGEASSSE